MATLIVPLAVGLASRALIGLITPTKVQEGQRLDDLDVAKSEYGYNLAKPFGKVRYNGCNMFWATPLREEVNTSGGGGKGGGNKNKTKEYTYFASFAVNFGFGECIVTRIWANGKLIYNPFSIEPATGTESIEIEADSIEIYGGTATQTPSPTIENVEGIGNVPAFRGRPYIVFNDLEVTKDFNSAVPKIDVEVIANYTDTIGAANLPPQVAYANPGESANIIRSTFSSLIAAFNGETPNTAASNPLTGIKTQVSEALRYICNDTGLAEGNDYQIIFDKQINGSNFKQNGDTYKSYLEDLQRTYQFIAVSDGGKILFLPQDGYGDPLALDAEDLGSREDGDSLPDKFKETRNEETELPTSILFDYKNVNKDHQRGVAQATRFVSTHRNEVRYNTENVLDDTEALTAANRNLYQSWAQRQRVEGIKVLPQYIPFIKPGYRLTVPIRGQNVDIQVDKISVGANYLVEVSGVIVDYSITSETIDKGTDLDYSNAGNINIEVPISVVILDIPLLSDADALLESGLYGGAIGDADDNWNGGTIVEAPAATLNYDLAESVAAKAVHGTLSSSIPSTNPFVVDENTVITVIMDNGILESITQASFDASLPAIMILSTGEIIAYRDAVLVSPNTYEISYLARGLYGTEQFIGAPTPAGGKVYFLRESNFFKRFNRPTSDISQVFDYKALFPGEDVTTNPNTFTQTYQGISLRPYAPVLPEITLDTSNNLLLSWTRRTRFGGGWTQSNLEVPVNEAQEQFDIEILDGSATTVLRTLTVVGNSEITYTNADIVADFGSVPTELNFNVYQISAVYGRGLPLEARNVPYTAVII